MKLYNVDVRSWTSWDHVKTKILFKYVIELANQQAIEMNIDMEWNLKISVVAPHSLNEKFIPLQDLLCSYLNAKSFTLHEHVYQHQQSQKKERKKKQKSAEKWDLMMV
jgi:hypothetical protein